MCGRFKRKSEMVADGNDLCRHLDSIVDWVSPVRGSVVRFCFSNP
jgi:hypothetical protein